MKLLKIFCNKSTRSENQITKLNKFINFKTKDFMQLHVYLKFYFYFYRSVFFITRLIKLKRTSVALT